MDKVGHETDKSGHEMDTIGREIDILRVAADEENRLETRLERFSGPIPPPVNRKIAAFFPAAANFTPTFYRETSRRPGEDPGSAKPSGGGGSAWSCFEFRISDFEFPGVAGLIAPARRASRKSRGRSFGRSSRGARRSRAGRALSGSARGTPSSAGSRRPT